MDLLWSFGFKMLKNLLVKVGKSFKIGWLKSPPWKDIYQKSPLFPRRGLVPLRPNGLRLTSPLRGRQASDGGEEAPPPISSSVLFAAFGLVRAFGPTYPKLMSIFPEENWHRVLTRRPGRANLILNFSIFSSSILASILPEKCAIFTIQRGGALFCKKCNF